MIFLSAWIFVLFAAVTLVQTKLAWYILPVYPPLSLTVAYVIARLFRERSIFFVRLMFVVIMALHVPYSHVFDHDYSRDIKGISPAVAANVPPEAPVSLYQYHESPAASFYFGRPSVYLDTKEELLKAAAERRIYLLIHAKDLEALGTEELSRRGLAVRASFEDLRLLMKK